LVIFLFLFVYFGVFRSGKAFHALFRERQIQNKKRFAAGQALMVINQEFKQHGKQSCNQGDSRSNAS